MAFVSKVFTPEIVARIARAPDWDSAVVAVEKALEGHADTHFNRQRLSYPELATALGILRRRAVDFQVALRPPQRGPTVSKAAFARQIRSAVRVWSIQAAGALKRRSEDELLSEAYERKGIPSCTFSARPETTGATHSDGRQARQADQEKQRTVFIGHGRSPLWRELKEFLVDRLGLKYQEFDRDPSAGYTTPERLTEMLDSSSFGLLVMTGEDEHADGTKHARENVIHEIGLCQGRYGLKRGIVLLAEGCEEFSNIVGLVQIRFPQDQVGSALEKVRQVLERERIIPPAKGGA